VPNGKPKRNKEPGAEQSSSSSSTNTTTTTTTYGDDGNHAACDIGDGDGAAAKNGDDHNVPNNKLLAYY
jgi:hypothetical protein